MMTRHKKVMRIYAEGMKTAMMTPAFDELREELDMSNEYMTNLAHLFFSFGVATAMRCHKELNDSIDEGDTWHIEDTDGNISSLVEDTGIELDKE